MEGLAARVLGEGRACGGGALHLSGESGPQEGAAWAPRGLLLLLPPASWQCREGP